MTAVDYAWSRPTIASLQAAGVTTVFRYVGPPGWGKTILQAEYDMLIAAGIAVYLVFENGADDSSGGFNAGVANAHLALQYVPVGYPVDYPIYYAADENLIGPALDTAVQYIRGASSAMGGPARTGDYGPGALCDLTQAAGYANHHWQSASTSFAGNAATRPETDVQQGLGGPIPGTDADTIVRPIISTPVSNSSSPQPVGVFMIPSGCTDVNAVRAQMREWWATYRTDPMPPGAGPFFDYFWKLPQNQTAWGKPGWSGNPDLALAWVIDDATTTGHLRPQFVGAV